MSDRIGGLRFFVHGLPLSLSLSTGADPYYRPVMGTGPRPKRSVLLSFRFQSIALLGSLSMALVCTFATLPAQLGMLGACVSILAGLFVGYVEQEDERAARQEDVLGTLRVPLALAPQHALFDQYSRIAESLTEIASQSDPVFREFASLKLDSLSKQASLLAQGRVVFEATETWRTVYENLLESPGLGFYLSASWVKTAEYWQDRPGRQSMRANYEFVSRGNRVERIVVLRGHLWPKESSRPTQPMRSWIEEQVDNGIAVSVVRESDLGSEQFLVGDFGIYGERAAGVQELDEHSRTLRFILQFDRQHLRLTRDRFERLSLYATSYEDL